MTEPMTSGGRRRPAMLAAAAAVAAVTLAGGIALVAVDDGDGPPKLDLGAGAPAGGGDQRVAESAELAADGAVGAVGAGAGTSMVAASVTYVAAEELPDLGGSAPVHRLVADDDDLRSIAAHLGLDGEVTEADGQRSIVDGDATVGGYGASWWYSSGRPYPGSEDEPVAAECDAEGICEEPAPRPEPERPADLPTQAEAEEIVRALAAAAGVDLTGARITSYDNVVTWTVDIELALDGTPVPGWSVYGTVMEGGAVLDAGGAMGRLEQVGDYPLDTTRTAIDRLNEQSSGGGGDQAVTEPAPEPMPAPQVEGGDEPAVEEPEGDGDAGTQTEPAPDEMTIMPVEGGDPGEPIEVTLRSAELTYAVVGNADGTETYLVPVYLLDGEDGRGEAWTDVFAVAVAAELLGA